MVRLVTSIGEAATARTTVEIARMVLESILKRFVWETGFLKTERFKLVEVVLGMNSCLLMMMMMLLLMRR